jgi:PBP1b-binding outer membrane lipoprotein LpoB
MTKIINIGLLLLIAVFFEGCHTRVSGIEKQNNVKKKVEMSDAEKEHEIAIKKKDKRLKKVYSFNKSRSLVITDVEIGSKKGEITAHSARIDRINTGTFEFHGIFNISEERGTLQLTPKTKIYINNRREHLAHKKAEEMFYISISKPSSYYILKLDNDNNIIELQKFTSHIYYTAEELHRNR